MNTENKLTHLIPLDNFNYIIDPVTEMRVVSVRQTVDGQEVVTQQMQELYKDGVIAITAEQLSQIGITKMFDMTSGGTVVNMTADMIREQAEIRYLHQNKIDTEEKIALLEQQLIPIKFDIEQVLNFNEKRDDLFAKQKAAHEILNQIRILKGKPVKNTINNA